MSGTEVRPPESTGAAVARGFTTLLASRALVMGLQFVTIALLADQLGPAGLGVYTFGVAVATMFRLLPNFGTVQVVTRDIAQDPSREPELLPNLVYLRLVLGAASYAVLAAAMLTLGFEPAERDAALIAGLVLFVGIDAFRAALEVRLRLGWVSIADMLEAVATVAGVVVLAARDAPVEAYLWLYVALKVVNGMIVAAAAMGMASLRARMLPRLWSPLLRAAVPLGLAAVVMALYFRLDMLLLARLKPPDDVGQYGAAYRFLDAFMVLPTMVMSVLGPVLARSVAEGSQVLQRRFDQSIRMLMVVAVFVAVAGAMTAWRVLPALPGFDEFEGAGVALAVLSPAAALVLMGTVVQGALISGHHQRVLLGISSAGLLVNLVLNVLLIPWASYVGAAAATTATEVLLLLLSVRVARRRMRLHWTLGSLRAVSAAGALAALALVPAYWLPPLAQLGIGALAYAAALVLMGGVRRSDLEPFRAGRLRRA